MINDEANCEKKTSLYEAEKKVQRRRRRSNGSKRNNAPGLLYYT